VAPSIYNIDDMHSEHDHPVIDLDSSDDDKPISEIYRSQSRKRDKPKKEHHSSKNYKKSKKAKATEETDPGLGLKLLQIGPSAKDYHPTEAGAVSSLRQGETVAAFLIPNEAGTAPNLAMHQSTRHHLQPTVVDKLIKLETTMARDFGNGLCTKAIELKGIPSVVMDNSYGTSRTHAFHRSLSPIYEELYPGYRIHVDRQFVRNVETPTVAEMKEKGFWYWNFHREGECHQKNKKEKDDISGLGSLAFICVSAGRRSVVTIRGPQPSGTVDWQKARASDVDPSTHEIIVYDFHVPKDSSAIILLQQNCWHGVAPYGQSTGSYAGFQTEEEYQRIKARFTDLQRKAKFSPFSDYANPPGSFLVQHVPFLRRPSFSTGLMFTWEEVVAICIVMGAPFPLYGSCKVNVMDGADKSCRNLPGPMSLFMQEPRLDSDGEPCIGPTGQPKRMLCRPSFRPDGTVAHTDPDYRRQVEELGIRIHDDCWAKEFPLWVYCPLQMHNTYGADHLMRIGLIPMNSTL
jgi:hypothetical protein